MLPGLAADKPPTTAALNPGGWRFTWEAQSHTTTLRLLLFNSDTRPAAQCSDLKLEFLSEQFLLLVSFFDGQEAQNETTVRVPVPRVLIDSELPIHFKALEDHIEVKLVLLLPLSHPLVSDVDSILNLDGNKNELHSLTLDSDLKKLSSMEEVCFYCRSCSTKLTKGFRCFDEMPSVNWRDVADNWFGSCCCSFGSVSEKLVAKYAKSYTCAKGVCLLSATSVLLSKDDVLGRSFPYIKDRHYCQPEQNSSYSGSSRVIQDEACTRIKLNCKNDDGHCSIEFCSVSEKVSANPEHTPLRNFVNDDFRSRQKPCKNVVGDDSLSGTFPSLQINENEPLMNGSFIDEEITVGSCNSRCCASSNESYDKLPEDQKVFLDGFLGDGFILGSSALSKDIKWTEFSCPQCLCIVGAYPCFEDNVPLDGGIRLFKCCVSTCLPVSGLDDAFRNYTLERMFSTQLLESAEDELSFRTLVRDIQTKTPVLQIVLLNPNSWCCAGYCLLLNESVTQLCMRPIMKVLFSSSGNIEENYSRTTMENWARTSEADELYMFSSQLEELIRSLELSSSQYPPSYMSLQGLCLSSMKR